MRDELIRKLKPNSIIVMDNASYHSRRLQKIPTKSSTKQEMKDWQTSNGMQFPEKALKCEHYSLIVSSYPVTVYVKIFCRECFQLYQAFKALVWD